MIITNFKIFETILSNTDLAEMKVSAKNIT